MNHVQLHTLVCKGMFTPTFYAPETQYITPSTGWLLLTFYPWFKKKLETLETSEWRSRFSHNDFATAFALFAQFCHAITKDNNSNRLAVGELWYKTNKQEIRAINVVLVDDNKLIFIDPETGQLITLNQEERQNVYFVRF